jgi:hypothetical protein
MNLNVHIVNAKVVRAKLIYVFVVHKFFFDRFSRGIPYLFFFFFQLNERMLCTVSKRERKEKYKATRPKRKKTLKLHI